MPFIKLDTNIKLEKDQFQEIKKEFGEMISLFPGKSESWLMCEITDEKNMYFKGSDKPCAYINVKIFGQVNDSSAQRFTEECCDFISKFGIEKDRIYITYEGSNCWGWNGNNF